MNEKLNWAAVIQDLIIFSSHTEHRAKKQSPLIYVPPNYGSSPVVVVSILWSNQSLLKATNTAEPDQRRIKSFSETSTSSASTLVVLVPDQCTNLLGNLKKKLVNAKQFSNDET